jgi:hypothetical protein
MTAVCHVEDPTLVGQSVRLSHNPEPAGSSAFVTTRKPPRKSLARGPRPGGILPMSLDLSSLSLRHRTRWEDM